MIETIQVDDLLVEIRRSPRRKTVDLTVDRSGELVVAVPVTLACPEIEKIIRAKQLWIYTTLEGKEDVLHPQSPREYVTGEGFYYLGRKYRLKVIHPEAGRRATPRLQWRNGRFFMRDDVVAEGGHEFVRWYTSRGQEWIPNAVDALEGRIGAAPRSVSLRDLRFRWGSCTSAGDIYFHWRVMLLPPQMIRYLILHELVHLHEHDHSPSFYSRLAQVAPDYQDAESWLKSNGDRYTL